VTRPEVRGRTVGAIALAGEAAEVVAREAAARRRARRPIATALALAIAIRAVAAAPALVGDMAGAVLAQEAAVVVVLVTSLDRISTVAGAGIFAIPGISALGGSITPISILAVISTLVGGISTFIGISASAGHVATTPARAAPPAAAHVLAAFECTAGLAALGLGRRAFTNATVATAVTGGLRTAAVGSATGTAAATLAPVATATHA
jgi:hypothetical protein